MWATDGQACLGLRRDEIFEGHVWAVLPKLAIRIGHQVVAGEDASYRARMVIFQALPFCFVLVKSRILSDELRNIQRYVVIVNLTSVLLATRVWRVTIGNEILRIWFGLRRSRSRTPWRAGRIAGLPVDGLHEMLGRLIPEWNVCLLCIFPEPLRRAVLTIMPAHTRMAAGDPRGVDAIPQGEAVCSWVVLED